VDFQGGRSGKVLEREYFFRLYFINYFHKMNTLQTINTDYLKASRSIETILVTNEKSSKVFFMYNYEGNSYRVFENHLDLINFFQNKAECDFHFSTEKDLDYFLSNVKI
jgi:hypothetical protein